MSDQLIEITLARHLECLRTRSNLYLPLDTGSITSDEQRVRHGLSETGLRTLEVIQARYQAALKNGSPDDQDAERHLAEAIGDLLEVWQTASDDGAVWEEGIREILGFIKTGSSGMY